MRKPWRRSRLHAVCGLSFVACLLGASAVAGAESPTLLVLGDSLSAGQGVEPGRGWVRLLEARLAAGGREYRVVNSSISGDTTRGGRARLGAALAAERPEIVIVELGGNDGLRGLPLAETRRNLAGIIRESLATGARVLLVGMRIPPNYGPKFAERFHAIYQDLARRFSVPLVPFLLEGVALRPELMQADGIHPRAEGQPLMLENLWPYLEPLL